MNMLPTSESPTSSSVNALQTDVQPSTSAMVSLSTLPCHLCRVTFTATKNLSRHIRTLHGDQSFPCPDCGKRFSRQDNLTCHQKTHKVAMPKTFDCLDCTKPFASRQSLNQHVSTHNVQVCNDCGEVFKTKATLTVHRKSHTYIPLVKSGDPHPFSDPKDPPSATTPPKGCKTALNGSYERHRAVGSVEDIDLPAFLRSQNHVDLLRDAVRRKKSVKFFTTANIVMVRPSNWISQRDSESRPYFTSQCIRVLEASSINELLEAAYEKIVDSMTQYLREGSGWVVSHINFVDLVISVYRPLRGSSYVKLPRELRYSRSIVNVKNNDNKCFLWAVLSALHPATIHPNRLHHYRKHETSIEVESVTFPVTLDQIPKFEELNGLAVNLFGYQMKEVFPILISESIGRRIDLLLISGGVKQHYCWINDFNRLIHFNNKHKGQYCLHCHHQFSSQRHLDRHIDKCPHDRSL